MKGDLKLAKQIKEQLAKRFTFVPSKSSSMWFEKGAFPKLPSNME